MKRFFLHLLFWVIILSWTSTIYDYDGKYGWEFLVFNLIRFPVIIASTYLVIYYFLPKWVIQEKRYALFALAFIVNFLLTTIIDRFIIGLDIITELLAETGLIYTFFNEIPIVRNAFILLSIMGLAAGIQFFKLYLKEEQRKHQLQAAKLSTELNFLKTQVNPHFLFNALNNLYGLAIEEKKENIAAGLEHLSGIMRYLTYESNADKVPLEKEIQLLQNYIEIQNLRLSETDDITISFQIKGNLNNRVIAPVVLLPLVENAFKHGVQAEQKCLVDIRLSTDKDTLNFEVKNGILPQRKHKLIDRGIGLENVQKRLTLIYPVQHEFEIIETKEQFIARLSILL